MPNAGELKSLIINVVGVAAPSYPEIGFSSTSFSGTSYKSDLIGHYFNNNTGGVVISGTPYTPGVAFGSSGPLKYADDGSTVDFGSDYTVEYVYDSAGKVWVKHNGRLCFTGTGSQTQDPSAGTNPMFTGLASGHYVGLLSRDTVSTTATINPPRDILTLASDQNLSSFGPGDSIAQDSGYTPETSAITGVSTAPNNVVRTWSTNTLPTDLQSILDGNAGTEVYGGASLDAESLLVVVHQSTAVDGATVWPSNGTASFGLDNGTGLGDGHYSASGNRIGGIGGYGNSEWSTFTFGGTVDDTYTIL